jgi:hypothetical protein
MSRHTFVATASAAALPLPSLAAPANRTLRFVPQAALSVLDPVLGSANVTINRREPASVCMRKSHCKRFIEDCPGRSRPPPCMPDDGPSISEPVE